MERELVYNAINSERVYQDEMSASLNRPDMIENMHLGDILSAISHNLQEATSSWYSGASPHEKSMTYLRKIAALCVKAGEIHGMPLRFTSPNVNIAEND